MTAAPAEIFKAYDVRGLYGERDRRRRRRGGRAARSSACWPHRGKAPGDLRVGLGRDMRLSAPELAARYRDGMMAEGAHVLDAGQVGTEMLYFLVGSRELDGGLMCTASHNPAAYTGAKLVERGAVALSGDTGIGEIRDADRGRPRRTPQAAGSSEEVDVADEFREARARVHRPRRGEAAAGRASTAATAWPGRWSGPLLERLGLDLVTTYWTPDGALPRPRAQPAAGGEPPLHHRQGPRGGRRPRHRLGRRRRPLLLHRRHGPFVDGDFLTALLAESVLEKQPGADILYDVRASRAVPDVGRAAGGTAHVNRVGHAFFKRRMRDEGGAFGGEVSGHYYFADFYNADSGTIPALLILELLSKQDAKLSELLEPLRSTLLHLRRDQLHGRRRRRPRSPRSRSATATARSPSSTALGRLRRLALQRAPVQHGAAAAAQPREPRLPRGHGAPARRGAGADPLVIRRRDPLPAIPTPFAVGRVNCYLIEDDPLTLVDSGPNSGKALDELEQALARARPPHRGPRADRHHPPAHRPPRAGRHPRAAARAPRSCALDLLAPVIEDFGARRGARRRARRAR